MSSTHTHYAGVMTRGQPEPSRFGCGPSEGLKGQRMTIKAIETRYKGYRFRSRLEARWAVFFDALGLEWKYEPEGFELQDGTRYLPDFWISFSHPMHSGAGYWIEVKGNDPTTEEIKKAQMLACGSGHICIVLSGEIGEHVALTVETNGAIHAVLRPRILGSEFTRWAGFEDIASAFAAARGARFEHGESGAR